MNPIYEEITQKEEAEVAEAVHKFADAVDAFQKLNPHQKEQFFRDVMLQKCLSDILNGEQYEECKV